ncbi:hypothetical protein [uncultured Brevibacillus sp.]|uniref:hypothetical protein n=1 Tax=uncultured Brevibacillus sp. TaxID=169970 RepID=UPI00338F4DFA
MGRTEGIHGAKRSVDCTDEIRAFVKSIGNNRRREDRWFLHVQYKVRRAGREMAVIHYIAD